MRDGPGNERPGRAPPPRPRAGRPSRPWTVAGLLALLAVSAPREVASVAAGHGRRAQAPVPSRAAEAARDPYSKPQEVYDFIGVGEGDQVADLLAGDGYNTYLLSERVGPSGKVYVEGASPRLLDRLGRGDLRDAGNVVVVGSVADLPSGALDAVVAVRAYHLFPDPQAVLAELYRALRPAGVVGVVEVRLNRPRGHDMMTHRVGELTVVEDFERAGFEYVGASDILRRDDDDYTDYRAGQRHMTDRMLLKFRKPVASRR